MDKKFAPVDIIDLLAYQEYKLALLYNLFGAIFPEFSALWAALAVDEIEHQRLIGTFKRYIDEGKIYFRAMISKVEFVEEHIKTIEWLIEKFEKEPLDIKEALKTAVKIENSMLDQDLFVYFSGDGDILRDSLKVLSRDTFKHYNELLQEAQKVGAV